jgi:quinolinate synthase
MAMNNLRNLAEVLQSGRNELFIPAEIRKKALRATQRMIDFAAGNR